MLFEAAYISGLTFVLGAIVGSFLNVVLYRIHTNRSLSGNSHCLSCEKQLHWYELIPLLSYVFLRGRCAGCGSYIPTQYLLVEFMTALAFVGVWHTFQPDYPLVLLNLVLASLLVLTFVYDLRHTIIPDELVVGIATVALLCIGYGTIGGSVFIPAPFAALTGAAASGAFFFVLWYISRGRWLGFGDVKLAVPFGALVGLSSVFSMIVLSFWIGAVISVVLLALQRFFKRGKRYLPFSVRPLTIKSEVPFAPFLIAGFLIVYLYQTDVFVLTYALFW